MWGSATLRFIWQNCYATLRFILRNSSAKQLHPFFLSIQAGRPLSQRQCRPQNNQGFRLLIDVGGLVPMSIRRFSSVRAWMSILCMLEIFQQCYWVERVMYQKSFLLANCHECGFTFSFERVCKASSDQINRFLEQRNCEPNLSCSL